MWHMYPPRTTVGSACRGGLVRHSCARSSACCIHHGYSRRASTLMPLQRSDQPRSVRHGCGCNKLIIIDCTALVACRQQLGAGRDCTALVACRQQLGAGRPLQPPLQSECDCHTLRHDLRALQCCQSHRPPAHTAWPVGPAAYGRERHQQPARCQVHKTQQEAHPAGGIAHWLPNGVLHCALFHLHAVLKLQCSRLQQQHAGHTTQHTDLLRLDLPNQTGLVVAGPLCLVKTAMQLQST